MKKPKEVIVEFVAEGGQAACYLSVEGVRIAKRGHKGSRHAMTWIPLEPIMRAPPPCR